MHSIILSCYILGTAPPLRKLIPHLCLRRNRIDFQPLRRERAIEDRRTACVSNEMTHDEFPTCWLIAFDRGTVYIPIKIFSSPFGRSRRRCFPVSVKNIQVKGGENKLDVVVVEGSCCLLELDFLLNRAKARLGTDEGGTRIFHEHLHRVHGLLSSRKFCFGTGESGMVRRVTSRTSTRRRGVPFMRYI
jgi:hypothetical protein